MLRKILFTTVLFACLIPLYCQPRIDQAKLKSFSNEIEKIVKNTKVVGVSVALIDSYEVVWAKGFGFTEIGSNDSVTTETLFQAASITKSFTALAVMKKIQEGKISLSENVDKQLTSWHIPRSDLVSKSSITVKQLLSHTAGIANSWYHIPGYKINDELPTIIQSLNGEKPAENDPIKVVNAPGTMFTYSNCGYWILECLLDDIDHKAFEDIIYSEVLEPLELNHSTFENSLSNQKFKSIAVGHIERNEPMLYKHYVIRPLANGGLWSTPTDLAKFLIEMQLSIKGKSNKIINEDNAKMMVKPVTTQYSLGFQNQIRGTGVKFFGHDGHNIGYISSMIGSLDKGFGVVIMTNSENGWKAINKIKKIAGRKFWGF